MTLEPLVPEVGDLVAGPGPSRRSSLTAAIGGALAAVLVLIALISLVWTPFDATAIDPEQILVGPGTGGHLLGTDNFGSDVFSQLMVGARVTLLVGVVSVAIAGLIGTPLGVLAAMRRGVVGGVIVRAGSIMFGFPALLLALLLAAAFGASTVTAMVAIGVATIPAFLRLSYASTLQVMSTDYVTAARTSGLSGPSIARRHVLPNISSTLLVQSSVAFALAVLAEAGLAYLGLSSKPPTPSWGRMLHDAQNYLFTAPELSLWPGLAIAASVLAFNLLGDGLRDLLDPKLRQR